jgi:hypothetical protein
MHNNGRMKAALVLTAIGVVVMLPWLGCAKEQSRTAARPPSPADAMGRTELQAPSPGASSEEDLQPAYEPPPPEASPATPDEPPAPDAQLGVRPDGTPVTAANIVLRSGKVRVPDDAALTASMAVHEIRAFPEETTDEIVAVAGLDRTYRTKLSYRAAVRFFDRTLVAGSCEATDRSATESATVWSVRCAKGEHAHVAVRKAIPTSIEIVEANKEETQ